MNLHILEAAAREFASRPYGSVSLEDVADTAELPVELVTQTFPTIRDAAVAVLNAEGASMREAQRVAGTEYSNPLEVLRRTFEIVGRNMTESIVVRAGMRIAAESRDQFPERKIDPYRTWRDFIIAQLALAEQLGMLRSGLDLEQVAWTLVAAGIGTKELAAFQGIQRESGTRFAGSAALLLRLLETSP